MKTFALIAWMLMSVFMLFVTAVTLAAVIDLGIEAFDIAVITVFVAVTGVCIWQARRALIAVSNPENRVAGGDVRATSARGRTQAATQEDRAHSPLPPAPSGLQNLERMLLRSTDLAATLRDIASHSDALAGTHQLVSMLKACGMPDWSGAPKMSLRKLGHNGQYWISVDSSDIDEDDYDRILSIEAALNINRQLSEGTRGQAMATPDAIAEKRRLLAQTATLEFKLEDSLSTGGGGAPAPRATQAGDYDALVAIATGAETAPAPFRVSFSMQVNVEKGCAVVDLEVPRAQSFGFFSPDADARSAAARAYAYRSALLMGRICLQACDGFRRAVVNCHEHGRKDTVLSLDLTPQALDTLLATAHDVTIDGGAVPQDEHIRVATSSQGVLMPVWPALDIASALVNPPGRYTLPELDRRPCPAELKALTGARTLADLGINEHAPRVEAWGRLRSECGDSTERLVSALVRERDENPDITVAEACIRTIDALFSADLAPSDEDGVGLVFISGGNLDVAARRAEALGNREGDGDPLAVIALLEQALAPIDDMALYEDDVDTLYRYFGSVVERIHFNLNRGTDCRAVRLVPDAYFNAHHMLVMAYTQTGDFENALSHADTLIRLAPSSARALLTKTRVLEARQSLLEAVEVAKQALCLAMAPADAALVHYRLAYLEWQVGREDIAVACYERSLAWDSNISEFARTELDDLLRQNPDLEHLNPEQACEKLLREGIDPCCDNETARRLRETARLCANAGSYELARPLTALAYSFDSNDVLMDVYRAFAQQ